MGAVRTGSEHVALGVLVGSALLGLGSCSLFDSDDRLADRTGDGRLRVLVVGDSVTVLSQEEIRRRLDWADVVDIQATEGLRTDELLPGARQGEAEDPDVGIFMPGYNDVLPNRVDTDALPTMMEIAAQLPCSVWFLLPADGGYAPELVELWNQRVRSLAADHENVVVADDWKRLVEASPDFTFVSELDAVHPNRDGQQAIATVMTDRARDACG
jgi:hypothetical protein